MTNAAWWDDDLALSISSYQQNHQEGLEACERLLSFPGLPPHIEDCARRNQTWYLAPLDGGGVFQAPPYRQSVEITLGKGNIAKPDGWSLFNPSIARSPYGHLGATVRSANYHIEPSGRYAIHDDDGVIRSHTYIGGVSDTLGFGDWYPIDTRDIDGDTQPSLVRGLEDCRLFRNAGDWQISATVRDRHPEMMCQIAWVTLDNWHATRMVLLSDGRRHEKNWMPYASGTAGPRFAYSLEPPTVVEVIPVTHEVWTVNSPLYGPYVARSFRGGSQVIWVPDRGDWEWSHLCLVHESVDFPEGTVPRRVYQHRFVALDHNAGVSRVSLPFCFQGRGIEFAAGMVVDGDDVIISYGTNDERAWLLRVPLERVFGMLREVL